MVEVRIDVDGQAYTQHDFIAYYGDYWKVQWDESRRAEQFDDPDHGPQIIPYPADGIDLGPSCMATSDSVRQTMKRTSELCHKVISPNSSPARPVVVACTRATKADFRFHCSRVHRGVASGT